MCNCIELADEKLDGQMVHATLGLTGGPRRPLIGLIRKDNWKLETRRSKPSNMIASFCPFCGEKYPEIEGNRVL